MKIRDSENPKIFFGCIRMLFVSILLIISAFIHTGCSGSDDENKTIYTVIFETDGGTPVPAIQRVEAGGTVTAPSTSPVKTGYVFVFWYVNESMTTYNFQTPVNSDITLYAKWTAGSGTGGEEPEGYQMFTSIPALKSWLSGQPDNTAETVYKVGLKNVNLDNGNNWGDLGIAINNHSSKYIDLYLKECAATNIPDGYYEKPNYGTTIYYGIFLDCENLVAVTLPKGLKTISVYAFWGCKNLQAIVLSDELTEIHQEAFRDCLLLSSINFPEKLVSIESYAFRNCNQLTSFIPPKNLKRIGEGAFQFCGLTTLTIPVYLNDINFGYGVFANNKYLTTVIIEEGIETLWENVFHECTSLESVTLPQSLKVIEQCVFERCKSLKSIEIPKNVTSIGASAFSNAFVNGDASLIMRPETPPKLAYKPFYTLGTTLEIKVPAASLNSYKTANGWSEYASKIVANTN